MLKIRWGLHLTYLTAIIAGLYLVKMNRAQDDFLKTDIKQVQELTLPRVQRSNELHLSNIKRDFEAYQTPQNEERFHTARHAMQAVDIFAETCIDVKHFSDHQPIYPFSSLAANYYLLGDSLRRMLPQDTVVQKWTDRCLSVDDQDGAPGQLAVWLTNKNSSEQLLIAQNLHLKAALALNVGYVFYPNG